MISLPRDSTESDIQVIASRLTFKPYLSPVLPPSWDLPSQLRPIFSLMCWLRGILDLCPQQISSVAHRPEPRLLYPKLWVSLACTLTKNRKADAKGVHEFRPSSLRRG